MPKVEGPSEREQLDIAFGHFSKELKHSLIVHDSTEYFVNRKPRWQGHAIEVDGHGQKLNGVLSVGYTTSLQHPVWSPIDAMIYQKYIGGHETDQDRDSLAKQILDVLYTVRNNTVHGGKRMDDANDWEVVRMAAPLLKMVVLSFLY